MHDRRGAIAGAIVGALLLAPAPARPQSGGFRTERAAAPHAVPLRARDLLERRVERVTTDAGARLEFWFRRRLPSRSGPAEGAMRVSYSELSPGELVGAVRVTGVWSDSRGQRAGPGIYLLRYAIQPLLKEHVGSSPFRDFLLLARADLDPGRAVIAQEEAMRFGRASAEGGHPLVVGLRPVDHDHNRHPAPAGLTVSLEGETILVTRVGGLPLALVVSGRAEAPAPGAM